MCIYSPGLLPKHMSFGQALSQAFQPGHRGFSAAVFDGVLMVLKDHGTQ